MRKFWTILSVLILCNGFAQSDRQFDPDPAFFSAREMAFEGRYEQALDTLNLVLQAYPEYTDVRNLLAKVHSWNGEYDEARKQFNRITSNTRDYREGWIAAINNEIYAQNYSLALGIANKAMTYIGNDPEIAVLRNRILTLNQNRNDSLNSRVLALPKDPSRNKKEPVVFGKYANRMGVLSEGFVYTDDFSPVVLTGMEYIRYTSLGKIIPRINHGYRFEEHGFQGELDLYPRFSQSVYGFFNYGYSTSAIFPEHRAGAEVFATVKKLWEVSLGARYLRFEDGPVMIYTGSLGYYPGNNYLSLRPYITPRDNGTTSVSGHLIGRRYRQDREHFLGFNLIYGISPEIQALRSGNTLLAETLFYVEAQHVNIEYQFSTAFSPHLFRATLGIGRQEFAAVPGEFYWAFMAGFRYHTAF